MGELDWLREQIRTVWASFRAVMLARPPVSREQEDALLDFWVPVFLASNREFSNDDEGESRMLLATSIWLGRSSFWPSPHEFLAAYREAERREPPAVPSAAEPRARVILAPRPPESSADEQAREREEDAARRAAESRTRSSRERFFAFTRELSQRVHAENMRRVREHSVAGSVAAILFADQQLDERRSRPAQNSKQQGASDG